MGEWCNSSLRLYMLSKGKSLNESKLAKELAGRFRAVKRVSGKGTFHDQGAVIREKPKADETLRQSCQPDSRQLRIRLSSSQARRWLSLPPSLRARVTRIIFGSAIEGLDLCQLASLESELRFLRLTLINCLERSLARNASLDVLGIAKAIQQISRILGSKP